MPHPVHTYTCCACVQPVYGADEIEQRRTETTPAAVLDQRPSTNLRRRTTAVAAGIHSPSVGRTTTTTTVINNNNNIAAAIGAMIFSTESSRPVVVGALVVFLVAGCFCGPADDRARTQEDGKPVPTTGRTSRLQRPTQGNRTAANGRVMVVARNGLVRLKKSPRVTPFIYLLFGHKKRYIKKNTFGKVLWFFLKRNTPGRGDQNRSVTLPNLVVCFLSETPPAATVNLTPFGGGGVLVVRIRVAPKP